MASRKKAPNVLDFYKLLSAKLSAEADMVVSWIGDAHWGEIGRSREAMLRSMVATYLPRGLACGTGFIRGDNGDLSRQSDLIVYEDAIVPPLYVEDGLAIVRADAVRLVVEAKSTLSLPEFRRAVRNIRMAKALSKDIRGMVFALAFPPYKSAQPPLLKWLKDIEKNGVPADDSENPQTLKIEGGNLPDFIHVASGYQFLLDTSQAGKAEIGMLKFLPNEGEGMLYLWDWLLQSCRLDPTRQSRPIPFLREYLGMKAPGFPPAGSYKG